MALFFQEPDPCLIRSISLNRVIRIAIEIIIGRWALRIRSTLQETNMSAGQKAYDIIKSGDWVNLV
jgi:hypothetical protein